MLKELVKKARGIVYGKWVLVFCPFCKDIHIHTFIENDLSRRADCRNGTVYDINIVDLKTLPKYIQKKINTRIETI